MVSVPVHKFKFMLDLTNSLSLCLAWDVFLDLEYLKLLGGLKFLEVVLEGSKGFESLSDELMLANAETPLGSPSEMTG